MLIAATVALAAFIGGAGSAAAANSDWTTVPGSERIIQGRVPDGRQFKIGVADVTLNSDRSKMAVLLSFYRPDRPPTRVVLGKDEFPEFFARNEPILRGGIIDAIGNAIKDAFQAVVDYFTKPIRDIISRWNTIKDLVKKLKNITEQIIAVVQEVFDRSKTTATATSARAFSAMHSAGAVASIPKLATGIRAQHFSNLKTSDRVFRGWQAAVSSDPSGQVLYQLTVVGIETARAVNGQ